MTVKEFIEVVNYTVIDFAQIYEMHWDELFKDYDCKDSGKRIDSQKDLEPYYNYELDRFELQMRYGEYDNSAIYIKMPKPVYKNGQEIKCPCCDEKIVIKSNMAKCDVCGWIAD